MRIVKRRSIRARGSCLLCVACCVWHRAHGVITAELPCSLQLPRCRVVRLSSPLHKSGRTKAKGKSVTYCNKSVAKLSR